MLTLENLQDLYSQGNYEECISETKLFVLINRESIEALLLLAKSEYQLASRIAQTEENPISLFVAAYNSFLDVLKLAPNNSDALLHAIYIDVNFIRDDLQQTILYCNQLATSNNIETKANAFDYRSRAHFLTGDIENALADLDSLMDLNYIRFRDNRSNLDLELGNYYIRKTNIYLAAENYDQALTAFSDGFANIQTDASFYAEIANIALDHQFYELAGKASREAFLYIDDSLIDSLKPLHYKIKDLTEHGITDRFLILGLFTSLSVLGARVGSDTVEVLSLAKKYIKIFPDWDVPYYYAGFELFDAGSYEEALPYLEKNLELGGRAYAVLLYIQASYYLTGKLPLIKKWPNDKPGAYYETGVYLEERMEATGDYQAYAREFLALRKHFYEIAYNGFYDYFYNQAGTAEANQPHTFAMCCNNYGIVLKLTGDSEKSVEVHQLGFNISPFFEQLWSWGESLSNLKRYEEVIGVLNHALDFIGNQISFNQYININGSLLVAIFETGKIEEAKILLAKIEQQYDDFLNKHGNKLNEYDRFELSESYINVQNIRYELSPKDSPEDAIKMWQEQLDKYPDDNSNWFMLMQNYFQQKDFQHCVACADNYEAVKGNAIKEESQLKVNYMRGVSQVNLGAYESAIKDLINVIEVYGNDNTSDDETKDSSISETSLYLAQCYCKLQQWGACADFAKRCTDIYTKNSWTWDSSAMQAMLYYADACKETGEKKAAIGTIDALLNLDPQNEAALLRKKEWTTGGLFSFLKKKS